MSSEETPLLGGSSDKAEANRLALHQQNVWKVAHFAAFFLGGAFFIVASAYYFVNGLWGGGIFFLLGSLSLLVVDIMEMEAFKFDEDLYRCLTFNAIGSSLYVVGSLGYMPVVPVIVGQLGFISGSIVLCGAQTWKLNRISKTGGKSTDPSFENLFLSVDQTTQTCVETGAFFGAFGFLIGTSVSFWSSLAIVALWLWMLGSISFVVGSLFIGYRHAVLKM